MIKQVFVVTLLSVFLGHFALISAEVDTDPDVFDGDIQSFFSRNEWVFQVPYSIGFAVVGIMYLVSILVIMLMAKDLFDNDYFYEIFKESQKTNASTPPALSDNVVRSEEDNQQNPFRVASPTNATVSEGRVIIKV